jgi:hypothetical protein
LFGLLKQKHYSWIQMHSPIHKSNRFHPGLSLLSTKRKYSMICYLSGNNKSEILRFLSVFSDILISLLRWSVKIQNKYETNMNHFNSRNPYVLGILESFIPVGLHMICSDPPDWPPFSIAAESHQYCYLLKNNLNNEVNHHWFMLNE